MNLEDYSQCVGKSIKKEFGRLFTVCWGEYLPSTWTIIHSAEENIHHTCKKFVQKIGG